MENPPEPSFSRLSFLAGFGFGAFIGGALALFAVALLQEAERAPLVVIEQPQATATAAPTGTPAAVAAAVELPTTRMALDVRIGPGDEYAIIGLLPRGDEVEPVGRSDDLDWVAIRFPPGSVALGWVPVASLQGVIGLDGLQVVLPTPLPRTITSFPTPDQGGADGTPVADGTPTPSASDGQPDLVITSLSLTSDRRLSAVVANRGSGTVTGFAIFVQFRNLANLSELVRVEVDSLEPGDSITVRTTTFRLEQDDDVQATVDPQGLIDESDESNNLLQRHLTLPTTPTPTPEGVD